MDEIIKRKIIVADICNTLFDSNTTFDFIRYCVDTNKLSGKKKLAYKSSLSRFSPLFWSIAVVQKITKKDFFKEFVVWLLKGEHVEVVKEWATEFYTVYLQPRSIKHTLEFLQQFENKDIVLASSTLHPIAEVITERLGFGSFISTEMYVDKGVYTGVIKEELSGKKLQVIQKRFSGATIDLVLTDNFTDKELMNMSNNKFAVCYDKRQEEFWSVIPGINIIHISNDMLMK